MKRKTLITAILCTACMAVSAAMPMTIMAEETEMETEEQVVVPDYPEYKALDYVTLGQYKGLPAEKTEAEVSDEEVEAQIAQLAQAYDVMEEVTEGTVADGDIANIDYEGKVDGEAFSGGTDKGYDLQIGSGTFIPGFEDGLIGVEVGDTVDVPVTFPENYYENLAGKDAVFTVTVNSIKRMPELTDEIAETISGGEIKTAEEFKTSIRDQIKAYYQYQSDMIQKGLLLQQVLDSCEVKEYPQELVDWYKAEYVSEGSYSADELDEHEEDLLKGVADEMILKAIAETEGLEVTDADYEAIASQYYFDSPEAMFETYNKGVVHLRLLIDKVNDFIYENADFSAVEAETEG